MLMANALSRCKVVTRNQTGYASKLYCLQLGLDCETTYQNTGLGIVYQLTQQRWSKEWRHVVWIVGRYWIFRDEVSIDDGLISFKCIRECKAISVLVRYYVIVNTWKNQCSL